MPGTDTYLTIAQPSEGIYKEKGSKFIAYAFSIDDETAFKTRLDEVKKMHHAARHHCYAYRLGADKKVFRANDDGEPGNSAGKPILGQIQAFDVTNILIVVVRYFGGTKLGVGGLIKAYRTAAQDALENASIVERVVRNQYQIDFEYDKMSEVMHLVKDNQLEQLEQSFDLKCQLIVAVRQAEAAQMVEKFKHIDVKIQYLRTA